MKHIFLPSCLLSLAIWLFPILLPAQTLQPSNPPTLKPSFQQEVNYRIAVTLDDQTHTLSGRIDIEYVNRSPDTLPEIWMHLWGNAFKNRKTAFSEQKLRDGSARFYFAGEKDLGYFKDLDFTVNGRKAEWRFDPGNPDIARLKLPEPLAPGARIAIATPFLLKIPASFSRLGHVGTSYQMTQWFPKPAVYDRNGWHPMPYLDMGEFFSEFGSFDVTITLPENYVVGATGTLQTPSEAAFLQRKVQESIARLTRESKTGKPGKKTVSDSFPDSSPVMKTIRYTAERVHDFAWFADKRFMVLHDTARLASGKTVDCWAMFTNSDSALWKKGAFYVRRAVEFYSRHVGEYPYPQATAVHSALSAGGGMEYPMITVIGNSDSGKDLDDVITHEVGHNWFYGILASNERDHPFLDEGVNSYYEHRYLREYYGDPASEGILPDWLYDASRNGPLYNTGCRLLAREGKDTPPDSHSNHFAPIAYGVQVYVKTALCLYWLEQAAGTERFDAAMQEYYRQWQFRHPYPEDLKAVFQKAGLDADWFFQAMQTPKQADFALIGAKRAGQGEWRLTVKNRGDLEAPFPVTALRQGEALETRWYSRDGDINFPAPEADAFVIDDRFEVLDLNRKNNFRRVGGLLPGVEPLEIAAFAPFENPRRSTFAVLPWLGWNNSDKAMLGAMLYNPPLPSRRFQYYLLPGYAFGSKQWVGLADLRYKLLPGGLFPRITVGVSAKTFDFDYNPQDDYYLKFYRFVPQVRAELRDNSISFRHFLNFRTLLIGRENDLRDSSAFAGKKYDTYTIYEARYEADQQKLPSPFHFTAVLEWQNGRDAFGDQGRYLRGSLEWKQQLYYGPKRKVTVRAFAGGFLQNDRRHDGILAGDPAQASFALNPQGFNDYRFDEVFLARSGASALAGRQVSQREGGFKGAFGSAYGGTTGNSNNFILALNLKADLPQRLPLGIPLKPWFDIGYFDDATPLGEDRPREEQLLWSGGFMLEFFKGGLEIYFPLINSKTLKDRYCEAGGGSNPSALFCGGNYWKWVSWSMKLGDLEPSNLLENVIR